MLKAIFGLLGLLIVLAVVSSLMKTQLGSLGSLGRTTTQVPVPQGAGEGTNATNGTGGSTAAKAVGGARLDGFAATAGAEMPSAQQQLQGMQQSVQSRTVDALKQGSERTRAAQP